MMKKSYTKEGVLFELFIKEKKISFPIKEDIKTIKQIYKTKIWETVTLLEELWLSGTLLEEGDGNYLIPYETLYLLEEEERKNLELPEKTVDVVVSEKGNVGAKEYYILWHCEKNEHHIGRYERHGNIILTGWEQYLLTKEQYELVSSIDAIQMPDSVEERGRELSKIKALAKKANAKLDYFTESREFHYLNTIDIDCRTYDDHHIELIPVVEGIPDMLVDKLSGSIGDTESIQLENQLHHIFVDPEVKQTYNSIKESGHLTGSDVPKFLENPLAYIPETVSFDTEVFAKRVRGLKIHKATAVPYIKIEKKEGEAGWFELTTGIHLVEEEEVEQEEVLEKKTEKEEIYKPLEEEELDLLIQAAADCGEDYVYYKNQWIKIDLEQCKNYKKSMEGIALEAGKGKINQKNLRRVLDIYDNLEGIEYNETYLEELLRSRKAVQYYEVSPLFQGQLKSYQLEGYSFLRGQYESGIGSILADDMGLGKTVQVISFLAYLKEIDALRPTLIVVPEVLMENWESEIGKFLPAVKEIYCHKGSRRYKNYKMVEKNEIVITTYETLARDQLEFAKIRWEALICDETQKIKNYNTLAACTVKGMNAKTRIAMTGTPVENRLSELWSIVDFVQPGLLQSYSWFKENYEEPIQSDLDSCKEKVEELVNTIHPIFLRRLKNEVLLNELPDKLEHRSKIELSKNQTILYEQELEEYYKSKGGIATINTIQRLIMLCSHPLLLEATTPTDLSCKELIRESSKLEYTVQLLKEIKKKKEKVLIFTKYKKMQLILRKVFFDLFHINAQIINGELKKERLQLIEEFNNSNGFNIMILSPKAAGVGLNITGANHVIHYTREWNPALESQATDRAYRIKQKRTVHVYYPIMTCGEIFTVEQKLDFLLQNKTQLMKEVVIPVGLDISEKELEDCLQK